MAFSPRVEVWRPLAAQFTADAPTDFLLDWIEKESGGNRCNLTTSAGFPEVGLFQLDPGNMREAGTDQDALRAGCDGQNDVGTANDQLVAMSTGVDYIKALKALAHQKLSNLGVDWSEGDPGFWSLVRLQHAAGESAVDSWLNIAATNLGRGPQNWDEFIANGCCDGRGRGYFDHWTNVAAEDGAWAQGWVPSTNAGGLTRGEIVLISITSIVAMIGAIYFDRWLNVGKSV
jgi:hypothetical protein